MAAAARQTGQRLLRACGRQRIKTRRQVRDRVVPGDRRVASAPAIALAFERLRDPVGVIRDLNGRLPARAQGAAVDRILGTPLELLRRENLDDALLPAADDVGFGVHYAHGQTAARLA